MDLNTSNRRNSLSEWILEKKKIQLSLPEILFGSDTTNVLKVKVCEKTTHAVTKESLLAMLISDKINCFINCYNRQVFYILIKWSTKHKGRGIVNTLFYGVLLTSKHEIILTDLKGEMAILQKQLGISIPKPSTVVRIVKLVNKQLHNETDT